MLKIILTIAAFTFLWISSSVAVPERRRSGYHPYLPASTESRFSELSDNGGRHSSFHHGYPHSPSRLSAAAHHYDQCKAAREQYKKKCLTRKPSVSLTGCCNMFFTFWINPHQLIVYQLGTVLPSRVLPDRP